MDRRIISTACVLGALAVILGAFGAHGLKEHVSATDLDNWKTAVSYHFYHTLALLFLSVIAEKGIKVNLPYIFFTLGIILFSGSLYLLSTRAVTGFSASFLGPVTPIGGLFFILGWLGLFIAVLRRK